MVNKRTFLLKYILSIIIYIISCFMSRAQTADSIEVINLDNQSWNLLKNDPDKAIELAEKGNKIAKSLNYISKEATLLNTIGLAYKYKGFYYTSVKYLTEGLKIREELGDSRKIANSLTNIGLTYEKLGINDSALNFFLKALQIREKNHYYSDLCNSYISLGNFYDEVLSDYNIALAYYNRALNSSKKFADPLLISKCYFNLGVLYFHFKNPQLAISYYDSSLIINNKIGDKNDIANTYNCIGAAYSKLDDLTKARYFYNLSISQSIQLEDKQLYLECINNLAELTARTNKKKSALLLYKQALDTARSISLKNEEVLILRNISELYKNMKEFKSAYDYDKMYDLLKDSLQSDQRANQISDLMIKYETDKKEHEKNLAVARADLKQKQLYYAWGAFALILALSASIFFLYRQRVRNKEQLAAKNEQINRQKIDELLSQQEIKSFEAMIEGQEQERKRIGEDLHDRLGILLSTVKLHFSSIENKLDKQLNTQEQFNKGTNLLDEALQEVRRIAHNISAGVLTNIGLVPALEDLKDTIEHSSHLKVSLFTHNMEERLDTLAEISIYRMIQELIGNILKHAQATEISINLNKNLVTNILTIIIEDDGQGFDRAQNAEKDGIGLKNIASRAERLHGRFSIDSNIGKGTTAIVEIPC